MIACSSHFSGCSNQHQTFKVEAFVLDFINNPAFHGLREKLEANLGQVDQIRVGSMFTGWGILEMVSHELQSQWNNVHGDGKSSMQAVDGWTMLSNWWKTKFCIGSEW